MVSVTGQCDWSVWLGSVAGGWRVGITQYAQNHVKGAIFDIWLAKFISGRVTYIASEARFGAHFC